MNTSVLQHFNISTNGSLVSPPTLGQSRELISVFGYLLLFIVGGPPNVLVLVNLMKEKREARLKIRKLLLNLTIADLIVTFIYIPTEVVWGFTNQWHGGDFLCRFLAIFRSLGTYMSSFILIMISLDRYYAVVEPLTFSGSARRSNLLIGVSWLVAALLSVPQYFMFSVQVHPAIADFHQCRTGGYFKSRPVMQTYHLASLIPIYFAPLLIIIFCYARIYLIARARTRDEILNAVPMRRRVVGLSRASSMSTQVSMNTELVMANTETNGNGVAQPRSPYLTTSYTHAENDADGTKETKTFVVTSQDSVTETARKRVLRVTLSIVIAFICCWTPYVAMNITNLILKEEAVKVKPFVRNLLFMFAVSNSCINPYIYGNFGRAIKRARARV